MPVLPQDDLLKIRRSSAKVCVLGERGIVWFGAKCFEILSFCHRMIYDPNQGPSDISSDVLLKIILSPVAVIIF